MSETTRVKVCARRIDDRPDAQGYTSSGIDLPTFWVQAVSAAEAARIGHRIVGEGRHDITRTIVQAYRERPDGTEEFADSTRWWLDGAQVEPTRVKPSYGRDGDDTTVHPGAEADADEVTWFTHDGCVWLHVTRTPRGKWKIETSDYLHITVPDYRRRFATPGHARDFLETRARVVTVEVDTWDTDDEQD